MPPRERELSSRNRSSRIRGRIGASLVFAVGMLAPTFARASERAEPAREPVTPAIELRYDARLDVAIDAGLAAAVVGLWLARDELQPGTCRVCDGSSMADLNAIDALVRDALRRPDTRPAATVSDVLAFGVAPLSLGGLTVLASVADERGAGALADVVIATQGTLAAMLVTETLKPIVVRPRPYAHALADPEARERALADPDALRSFPSGHATAVFAMAAATGTVATMRGYRLAPLLWAAGLMLGTATAYARIAADRHYFTDTLGGAAIGMAVGAGVPLLLHPPVTGARAGAWRVLERAAIGSREVPGGRVVSVGWAF